MFFFWQTVRTFQSPIENLCIKFFFLMFSENKSLEWNICLFYLKKIHEGCTRPCFCPMRELLYIIVIICRMREIFSSMRMSVTFGWNACHTSNAWDLTGMQYMQRSTGKKGYRFSPNGCENLNTILCMSLMAKGMWVFQKGMREFSKLYSIIYVT